MSVRLLNPWDYKVYFALIHSDKKHWTLLLSSPRFNSDPQICCLIRLNKYTNSRGNKMFSFKIPFLFLSSCFLADTAEALFQRRSCF